MKQALLFFFFPAILCAAIQEEFHKPKIDKVIAVRLEEKIELDGILNEHVWKNGYGVTEFRQREPHEGDDPTEQTLVHIAYDDAALYIGARMFDSAPDSIVAPLSRRDVEISADRFVFFIDPYFDKRSGYYFGINAGGTRYDGTLYNDEWEDETWDGVWEGRISRDDSGWCAEFRIPFSQLRFKNTGELKWGVNFHRDINRKKEENFLSYTPKSSSGFVSRFLSLDGIRSIAPPRHFELLPYIRTKAEFDRSQKDNPFHGGRRAAPAVGLDLKYGLGPNVTLDATINPDFGQVEVDPAVVNLSDFETFYEEKRPFFIEGSSIFNFSYGGSRSNWGLNWGNPDFFYSRRIGRAPQGSSPDHDHAVIPEATTIIGAGKLTGKIAGNWNIGGIVAATAREKGSYRLNGAELEQEIEPQTTYGVFRGQKEIDEGRRGIGFIATMTSRNKISPLIKNEFNKSAQGFGLDGWTFIDKEKMWVVTSYLGGTRINGSSERMRELQNSSMHYFQRPDAEHVSLDSSLTTLSGYSGRVLVNKQKGNVIFNSAFGVVSPGFNVNDLGFMFRSDVINYHLGFGYKWTKPNKIAREIVLIGAKFQSFDFSQNKTGDGIFGLGEFIFHNYHGLTAEIFHMQNHLDNRATRGGPMAIEPGGTMAGVEYSTDSRKSIILGLGAEYYSSSTIRDNELDIEMSIEWKPRPNLSLSVGPEWSIEDEYSQYVMQEQDILATNTYGKRYIFSRLQYEELAANIRLNWTFSPKLSFQLYMQPLISHGNYTDFKELSQPRTYDYHIYTSKQLSYDGADYRVTSDPSNPGHSFTFENPNFHVKSLRGNAVLRWEYAPGSTLYFVWTQDRSNDDYYNQFDINSSVNKLLGEPANNIFMVKLTYWWNG
jgi:hypothetical protein